MVLFMVAAQVMASIDDIQVTENKITSYYNSDTYRVAFTIKNTGSETVNNVVVVCEILDGYGVCLRKLTQSAGSLQAGAEYSGNFDYYRPDKSFQVYHRLIVKNTGK
jgi:hypothetical protein